MFFRVALLPLVLGVLVYLITRTVVLSQAASTVSEAERLLRVGKAPDAREHLAWLLYFDPANAQARLVAARCDYQAGQLSDAIEQLRTLFPESSEARAAGELLARYLLEDFQMEPAESVLAQLVARFPETEFAWEELRWLYFNQFRTRDVESLLLDQLARGPQRDVALIHLLMTEFRPPVPREGIGYLETIEKRRPGQLPVVRALALCHWQLGELDQARIHFEQALHQAPADPETLFLLTEFALEQNQVEMAGSFIRTLDTLEATEIREDRRHWAHALLFERQDDLPAALREVNRALELRPFELKYAYQRATLLSRTGQTDEAKQAYRTAKSLESAERELAEIVLSGSLEALTIEQALAIADLYERRHRNRLAEYWRESVDRFQRKAGE